MKASTAVAMSCDETAAVEGSSTTATRRFHDRDDLPETYLRWLKAQIPAIAASSKKNKQPGRWYSQSRGENIESGGGVGGKARKQLSKGWFTLGWTLDNVPIIPDGLW